MIVANIWPYMLPNVPNILAKEEVFMSKRRTNKLTGSPSKDKKLVISSDKNIFHKTRRFNKSQVIQSLHKKGSVRNIARERLIRNCSTFHDSTYYISIHTFYFKKYVYLNDSTSN
jgi:hypothetical protein